MALYIIGGVMFQIHPMNVHKVTHTTTEDFARHPVIGARPTFESVGHGEETLNLEGTLFPRKIGGEAELDMLTALQASASPVLVTQGNRWLGWFHILRIRRDHTFLDERGVGRKLGVQIELEKTDRPSIASVSTLFTKLFGYV